MVAAALLVMDSGRRWRSSHGMPASPLAGGMAAASGDVVDVHGNSIVMPASYAGEGARLRRTVPRRLWRRHGRRRPPTSISAATAPTSAGPTTSTLPAEVVVLRADDLFKDVPPLAAVGVAGPTIIDIENEYDDDEVRLADLRPVRHRARCRCSRPLTWASTTSASRIYAFPKIETAKAGQPVLPFQLNSLFSGYGLDPIDGLDEGEFYATQYFADLHSTELTYRRYWLGYSPRISGTVLAGFRYVNFNEDLIFAASTVDG